MNKSAVIAVTAVVALVLWMLSGQLGSNESSNDAAVLDTKDREITAMKVQTRRQSAKHMTREVIVQGQVEPFKVIHLRSESSGSIESIAIEKGERVKAGDVIALLSTDNREANLAVAKANRIQATNEYEGARKLQKQGLSSRVNLESLAAKLESARAQVQAAELEVSNLSIRAPIDALVDRLDIEVGDFVDRGDGIATLVDNSKLLVTGNVPQQNIVDVKQGIPAGAELITGESLLGEVRYVSSMADPASRSFRIEVLITNPPERAMTGVSAAIRIPVETIKAHLISPAILALSESGELGIKAVNDSNEVIFHAITVVKTESGGAWVTGIPDNINIITLGQGFVIPGETVQTVAEPEEAEEKGKATQRAQATDQGS